MGGKARPVLVTIVLCEAVSSFYSASFTPYILFLNIIFQLSLTIRIILCECLCAALWFGKSRTSYEGPRCEAEESPRSGAAAGPPQASPVPSSMPSSQWGLSGLLSRSRTLPVNLNFSQLTMVEG